MENQPTDTTQNSKRTWNKNKLIGQKSPLTPPQVWAIRVRLQLADRKRDLAMFNLALDSKLRGCDLMGCGCRIFKLAMTLDLGPR